MANYRILVDANRIPEDLQLIAFLGSLVGSHRTMAKVIAISACYWVWDDDRQEYVDPRTAADWLVEQVNAGVDVADTLDKEISLINQIDEVTKKGN